jgi:deazaflavin-dependent oxidoreductase (nitroreductase family)
MAEGNRPARLPPRWFIVTFWRVHRTLNKISGGRRFLWKPGGKRGWGALRLTTVGRRSGQERAVILGYLEDGPDLVVLAMNGWGPAEPAWWLNLQAHPSALARLPGQPEQRVVAHAAEGAERERLWERWREVDEGLDEYAARRPSPTAVVVLSPEAAA